MDGLMLVSNNTRQKQPGARQMHINMSWIINYVLCTSGQYWRIDSNTASKGTCIHTRRVSVWFCVVAFTSDTVQEHSNIRSRLSRDIQTLWSGFCTICNDCHLAAINKLTQYHSNIRFLCSMSWFLSVIYKITKDNFDVRFLCFLSWFLSDI